MCRWVVTTRTRPAVQLTNLVQRLASVVSNDLVAQLLHLEYLLSLDGNVCGLALGGGGGVLLG